MIKYSGLAIIFECVFIFLFSHRNIALFFFRNRGVDFISIKLPTMGKSNQKHEKRKTRNYPCVRKNGKHAIILVFEKTENTQLSLCSKNGKHAVILVFEKLNSASHKGIGSRKKKVISNSKTTTLTYFNKLKKKQQDQGGKYFYFSFRSEL